MAYNRNATFAAALLLATLTLSSLACRTLLGAPEDATFGSVPAVKATRTVSQAEPSQRLDGLSLLPTLDPGPPGASRYEPDRPQLSGEAYTLDSEHFRIHYTLDGVDAVPAQGNHPSGQPDYVIEVARAMEYAWYGAIDHFGWAPPPRDGGLGGDDRYDVYLQEILSEDYAGFTESDLGASVIGDNPLTRLVERAATHTYIVLDNDYLEETDASYPPEEELDYMRSTAAHEFHHAIQFGYDGEEPHDWVWEATSTWIEEELFDSVNDPVSTLGSIFDATDSCQLAEGGETGDEDIDRWYGMWILMRHLSEQYGHSIIVRLWEQIIDLNGYAAWDALLAEYDTTLEDVFTDYSVALLTRNFQEGLRYPTVRLEGVATPDAWFYPADGVEQLGADYIALPADEILTLTLDGEGLRAVAVGIAEGWSDVFPLQDGETSLDTGDYERSYLIVLNPQRAANARNCHLSDYAVFVGRSSRPQAPAWSQPAEYFQPPATPGR
ncbi:MAG: hypothetical protein KF828_00595 [Anaerolineales bacterium]|nr:hypothetical protein [Anaerolineales bacterium]